MTGILIIDKPEGLTSFGTLIRIKKIINQKKCGHTGTLDPMATGALTVLLGNATRFSELLPVHDKSYDAVLKLGVITDTLDITGEVLETHEVTAKRSDFESVLNSFRGKISQLPPMYSAVSVDGVRLYQLARKGETVERQARTVTIHSLDLIDCDEKNNEYKIHVCCSAGTYIRTLADDIGRALGCGTVLTSLRRTEANGYPVEKALTLDALKEAVENGTLADHIMSVDSVMTAYPDVHVTQPQAVRFSNGNPLMLSRVTGADEKGIYRVYGPDGDFLGLGENTDGENLTSRKIFVKE